MHLAARSLLLVVLGLAALAAGCAPPVAVSAAGLGSMRDAAERGEDVLGVPADLVLAVAYAETRFVAPEATELDPDQAHAAPALGVTGIRADLSIDPLSIVSRVLDVPEGRVEARLSEDAPFATLAASVVLFSLAEARYGDAIPAADDPGAWREVLADYVALDGAAGASHAEYVLDLLRGGVVGESSDGERILLRSRAITAASGPIAAVEALGAEYPSATWTPASSTNYTAGRGGHAIRYVVIHTTQGSYSGAISWFRNSSANVSAHYVIRSIDGAVTQMVQHADTGWHAGNWTYNQESIGIEHEGYVADPGRWYTDAMYRSSAALTRWICERHGIPMDRAHIIGHYEVPGATHTDPGSGWDWDRYMALVRGTPTGPAYDATAGATGLPTEMTSGERAVAWFEFHNTGTSGWDINTTRLGTSSPQDHASPFYDVENWMNDHRATGADHGYAPGTTGRFTFMVTAPEVTSDTTVTDTFRLLEEGTTWFGPEVRLSILVHPRPVVGPIDADGDGATADVDCDDSDPARFPDAIDVCGDGIDQDCTGADAVCEAPDAGTSSGGGDGGASSGSPDAGVGGGGSGSTRGPTMLSGGCSAGPRGGTASGVMVVIAGIAVVAMAGRRRR